jgi:drug/metabolite transporter (DMT)-like permease
MASLAFSPAETDVPRAVAMAVAAVLLFTVMGAAIKWLSPHYPLAQILFARNAFALIPLLPLILRAGRAAWTTRRPGLHAARCVLGVGSMAASFVALDRLPLANHVAIGFAAPLFVTALAVPLLGETVRWRRWTATAVGFAGVMLMVRPDGAALLDDRVFVGSLWGLAATFVYAVVIILIRRMSATESSTTIVLYFTLTGAAVSAAFLPFHFVVPTAGDAVLFVLVGVIGGVAQVLVTMAYRLAPASVVAPLDYTGMLWAAALGAVVWGDLPTPQVLAGAAVVIGSGLYILHRERATAAVRPPKPRTPLS